MGAELDSNTLEIDIDALIDDCIKIGQDCFLGEANFVKFTLDLSNQVQEEKAKLTGKLVEIINNRIAQEISICKSQADSQISQRQTEINAQLNQELKAKLDSINQILLNNLGNVMIGSNYQAEYDSFCASRIEQLKNVLDSYASTVIKNRNDKIKRLQDTAQSAFNQMHDEVLKLVDHKKDELIAELVKIRNQGNYIKAEAIKEYNKGWLQALDRKITAITNNSIDQIAQRHISCDYNNFEQFVEESGRKEEVLHKDKIKMLETKCETEHYVLSISHLEKLLDIIDDPKCASEHEHILKLICKSVINGTQLSQAIFKKLEHILERQEYAE